METNFRQEMVVNVKVVYWNSKEVLISLSQVRDNRKKNPEIKTGIPGDIIQE